MTVITYDVLTDLKSTLVDDWAKTKVNSAPLPDVQIVWDIKTTGFGSGMRDRIYITPINEAVKPFQLHGDTYWHELVTKIEIRTYRGFENQNNIVKTVSTIVKNNIRKSGDGFLDVIIMGSEPLSTEIRNMYRHVITLKYRNAISHTFV